MLKNKKTNKIIVLVLTILLFITIIFNINKQKEKIQTFANANQNKQFAMYIEKDNNYEIYNENSFPNIYRYHLNEEKSYCQDNKGTKLSNLITPNYDGSITVTSNKTAYCYLYFDEEFRGTGIELPKSESKGLSTEIKGDMYRYQGQATEEIDNYICFGTDDINKCISDPDHYMYRIIGVEDSGRIKVIKKEALNETVKWWDDFDTDKPFPDSKIYEALTKFLTNKDYVPDGWEEKISDNTWMYGDVVSSTDVAKQTGEELYLIENGKKESNWFEKSDSEEEDTKETTIKGEEYSHNGETFYYKELQGKWQNTLKSKISLMYLHDYKYSVSDSATCSLDAKDYNNCKAGWMHLSQNDSSLTGNSIHEWTMSRVGWNPDTGIYYGHAVNASGITNGSNFLNSFYIRPVFYLKNGIYFEGKGTEEEPFVIKEGKGATYIKNQKPNGLKLDAIRGDMYRYQSQQADGIENYICFGTSDKNACIDDTDKYMYRIIGIEAGTGRIKVIKKEALNDPSKWWDNQNEDKTFPESKIYEAISGSGFLTNKDYVPVSWEEKISNNMWTYGDIVSDENGSSQTGAGLYEVERGQKETVWYNTAGSIEHGKWDIKSLSKISILSLSDYNYSISDDINCEYTNKHYGTCPNGWIHLSKNDVSPPASYEWTIARYGWENTQSLYAGRHISNLGYIGSRVLTDSLSIRPTFYLNANVNISSGTGMDSDPFIIS